MQKKRQLAKRAVALFVDIDNVRPGFDLDMCALRSFVVQQMGEVKLAAAYVRRDSGGRIKRLARSAEQARFQVIPTSSNADGRMQFDMANLDIGAFRAIWLCSDDGGFADLLGYMAREFRMQISLLHSGRQAPGKLMKVSLVSGGKVLSMHEEEIRRSLRAPRTIPR